MNRMFELSVKPVRALQCSIREPQPYPQQPPEQLTSCTGARMTKGLHICRHLHKAGWRVVLVDYDRWWMQGSRWSACCDAFFTVPDPEQNPVGM